MRFQYQYVLWFLLVLPPALLVFFWWAMRRRRVLMMHFIQARLLPGLISGLSPTRQKIRFGALVAAAALLIIVLARPQWGYDIESVSQRGLDIVVAIDTSKSMLAEDIAPNRLERAKLAALDLMQQAKSDRLGLVAFAGSAFLQCPLTSDDVAFRQSVNALNVNIIPQGGTALAGAIKTALTAFKEADNYKVLVLFTDGEDNDQGALEAAEEAAKQGLRIFTVGVGTAAGELLRVTDDKGRTEYIRDEDGNVVKSHLNEKLLEEIARATDGGFYLPLRGANTVDLLYKRGLEPLPKTEQAARLVRHYHEQFHWPLAAAILLLLFEMLLPERRHRRRRSQVTVAEAGVSASAAAALMLLLLLPASASGSTASALREYKAGNYNQALREYQRLLQHNTNDARLQFNAGTAAYRNRRYDEAMRQFSRATTSQDLGLQQQSYYNLGNTLYRVGEGITNLDRKISSWEDALKQYDGAIKLNTNDVDAKFNYEFVKKKLEELKKQQQQQQKKDQQQNQQDKQQQNKSDQKNQQSQKQDQDQKNQQNQASNQQQKEKQDQQQQSQGQSEQQKQQQEKQQQAQSSGNEGEKKPEDKQSGQQAETAQMRPMTPQEAKQLLDAQKGDERVLLFSNGEPQEQREHPFKDW